jgi:iron complex outermembrane receptor protein
MNNKLFFLMVFLLPLVNLFAQEKTISGSVQDDLGDYLIGVNILYGPGLGVITDIDGRYSIKLPQGEYDFVISYVGCETQENHVVLADKNLYIDYTLKTITLQEVEIVGDIAKTRETPIAFSNVTPAQIDELLAAQDIPMILNATPGVYATASGGGDGDARINIRGFNQRNVAVMLDGIPVNDMENGWVYWSNWFGLDAVMRYTQVQRGLGASKLAIPSVGGTINIATRGIENDFGVTLKQEVGNNGFLRTSLGITSGRLPKGWGVTFAGSYKRGDGWADQTWTKGWFYFLRVDKEIGNHLISLSAMGAPQEHGQRSYKQFISTFDTDYALKAGMTQEFIDNLQASGLPTNRGLKYNPNWGYLSRAYVSGNDTIYPNREATSTASNFYHKPLFSLRDFWNVNDKLYVSNILYLSIGTGGGRSFSTTPTTDTTTWQQDLQTQYNSNLNIAPPYWNKTNLSSNIMRNAMNNHFWLGLLSTFDYEINSEFSVSGGVDLRTYRGEHYREIHDLFGGDYYLDDGNQNESDTTKKYEGDKIGYHNDALVRWGGLFAQVKYDRGNLTTFLNVTFSYSGNKRIDYFLPQIDGQTNETPWKYIPGFTVKGGANYNLNESMNVFMNLGFISKAQRFNNVFDRTNTLFRSIKNEQVRAIELGYSFVKPIFTLNVNTYYTTWFNKPADRAMSTEIDGERYSVNINNMNARHMGIEFEFAIKILDNLIFESLLSLGDWKWTSADTARVYDDNGNQIATRPFDAKGLFVGDAAQFQNRESLRWEITRGLYVSGVFTWFGKHYAEFNPLDYDPIESPDSFNDDGKPIQAWKIPDFYTIDFHAGYSWRIKKLGFQVRGTVLNAFDMVFITDAQNNDPYLTHSSTFDANSASVFMGMGRRFNLSLRLSL